MGRKNLRHFDRERLIWDAQIDPSHKLILLAYNSFLGANDVCWPSNTTICGMTGLSESTVIRQIKAMRSLGLLSISPRTYSGTKARTSNETEINWGVLESGVTVTPPPVTVTPPPPVTVTPPPVMVTPPPPVMVTPPPPVMVTPPPVMVTPPPPVMVTPDLIQRRSNPGSNPELDQNKNSLSAVNSTHEKGEQPRERERKFFKNSESNGGGRIYSSDEQPPNENLEPPRPQSNSLEDPQPPGEGQGSAPEKNWAEFCAPGEDPGFWAAVLTKVRSFPNQPASPTAAAEAWIRRQGASLWGEYQRAQARPLQFLEPPSEPSEKETPYERAIAALRENDSSEALALIQGYRLTRKVNPIGIIASLKALGTLPEDCPESLSSLDDTALRAVLDAAHQQWQHKAPKPLSTTHHE